MTTLADFFREQNNEHECKDIGVLTCVVQHDCQDHHHETNQNIYRLLVGPIRGGYVTGQYHIIYSMHRYGGHHLR